MPTSKAAIAQGDECSIERLCELFQVSPQRIYQLVNRGVIPRPVNRRYSLEESVASYVKHLRMLATGRRLSDVDDTGSRERLLKAKADLLETKVKRLRGELVDAEEVEQALGATFTTVRSRLLAMPHRAAPRVVGETDINVIRRALEDLVHDTLSELSDIQVEVFGSK